MFHLMLKTTTEALSHRTVATDIITFKKFGDSRRNAHRRQYTIIGTWVYFLVIVGREPTLQIHQ